MSKIRLLIGGSPCTYWSIAQKNNRETAPSGRGWELCKNYLIAKEKFKPDYFLYENNVSAAKPTGNFKEDKMNSEEIKKLSVKIATAIIDKGYRKQSEVIKEFMLEFKKRVDCSEMKPHKEADHAYIIGFNLCMCDMLGTLEILAKEYGVEVE